MITKLEINGFKTFENFEIVFKPFVVIAGSNGSGKSNLFDAIRLLSSLAEKDLRTAFGEQRGTFAELFTQYSQDQRADKMQFAVELFIDSTVKDDFNKEATLGHQRLRYEIHISKRKEERSNLERLYVDHEALRFINRGDDDWWKAFCLGDEWKSKKISRSYKPYINTENKNGIKVISIRQDGVRGGKPTPIQDLERSVLSGINDASYPHAFAVREEMRHWKQFQFSPMELRKPSPMLGADFIDIEGRNLAAMLKRTEAHEPGTLRSISRTIQNILPEIREVYIDEDLARNQYILMVRSVDDRVFSSNVLSEGTLRIIALVALMFDVRHRGLICFEEPENGIHPYRMEKILRLLKNLSTQFEEKGEAELPLRQVIVNTHSPLLVRKYYDEKFQAEGLLYFARLDRKIDAEKRLSYKLTRMSVVKEKGDPQLGLFSEILPAEEELTQHEVMEYLHSSDEESIMN
jgi:predicted ATPase